MKSGLVFNIQRYSVHDGPGIRTTVFLKGCPLRCSWCHNPEGISPRGEIVVLENRCVHCGECVKACEFAPADPGKGPLALSNGRCRMCGACVKACPAAARELVGDPMRVEEVMRKVLQDRVFYEESGGGVTFSGGEPLMQPAFLRALLRECRTAGLHSAVDTCGMARVEDLLAVAPLADLFLYDLKGMNEERHLRYTGVPNHLILENLRALASVHGQIWLRLPLVPGVNDDPQDLQRTAKFAATLRGIRQVNILPFHRTGISKAKRLPGFEAGLDFSRPTASTVAAAVAVFQEYGFKTQAGG